MAQLPQQCTRAVDAHGGRRSRLLSVIGVALTFLLLPTIAASQTADWDERTAAGVKAYREGRLGDAERYFAEAATIAERMVPRQWHLVTSLAKLGDVASAQGRVGDAEALYRQALKAAEELRGSEHPSLLDPIKGLALFYARTLQYADAERLFERALLLSQRDHDRESASYLHLISDLRRAQGKYPEAEALLRRALSVFERSVGTDERGLSAWGAAASDLVLLLRIQGKTAESDALAETIGDVFGREFDRVEPLVRHALASRTLILGPQNPGLVNTLDYLARLLESRKRYDEAESLYQRAIEILSNAGQAPQLTLAANLEIYAELLRKAGREMDARIREARAAAIRIASKRKEAATASGETPR